MKNWKKHKEFIMKELARLDELDWASDGEIAMSIYPYVLIEAINLLKNSEIVENPVDYAKTGEDAERLLKEVVTDIKKCKHCKETLSVRNPSGYCDHLYWPENCKACKADLTQRIK